MPEGLIRWDNWLKTMDFLSIRTLVYALFAALAVTAEADPYKVLVFSKTAAFRHDGSINAGIPMIQDLGTSNNFIVDTTEDSAAFTSANLANYKAIIFLCTTGDLFNDNQKLAFQNFIRSGGGYVGIHSASDTEHSWPWYGQLVGAYFVNHPFIQDATVTVADRVHPSTASLPERWIRNDEWYNFDHNPRGEVHVLATLDERTYSGGGMGVDHPTAWCHEFEGGRAWYTGGGHTDESYSEPLFQAHVLGGIEWAAGVKPGDGGATITSNVQVQELATDLSQPMEIAVAADGRVFVIEREGNVRIYKPDSGATVLAAHISVFSEIEDGLLGIVLDPGFATNQWLYLMYSPPSPSVQHISRFTVIGDTIDLSSEKLLLEVPTQRSHCCHSAGSLAFGPEDNLFISTGDNTDAYGDYYAPIDERPGRSDEDAQKSSANTKDLRGKILRIHPETNGTYSIPAGNLFATNQPNTRPEIYTMGNRNPFRISIDPATGWLYWGEVGPDAYTESATRGAAGQDELNQAKGPGNYGWPYFVGNNKLYRDFDYETGTPGAYFDPLSPTNNSPNNTGLTVLPPAKPALIWYPYGPSAEFPELGSDSSRTAMAGPVYHFNPNNPSTRKLPAYYDKTLFFYEFSRGYIKEIKLDADGNVLKINPFSSNVWFDHIIDMELGPDGALYIVERDGARLSRIAYVGGDYSPVARASGTPNAGSTPLVVNFSSEGSYDPNSTDTISFAWSFFGNGDIDSTDANPTFIYATPGNYNAQLTVTDDKGNQSVANVPIVVGNNRPTVTLSSPPNGALFDWGNVIQYQAAATDVEDGSTLNSSISCNRLLVEHFLGHNDHTHSQGSTAGCAGTFRAPGSGESIVGNYFLQIEASYTDNGAPSTSVLRGKAVHILQPTLKQAEYFTHSSGIALEPTTDPEGGYQDVAQIDSNDWISFSPLNLTNITAVTARVKATAPGTIIVHADNSSGPVVASISFQATSGAYSNFTASVNDLGGTHEYYFVFSNDNVFESFAAINWLDFRGIGANQPVVLQSASSVTATFADEPAAQINYRAHTITIPVTGAARFYKLRAGTARRIAAIQIIGNNVQLTFE